MTIVDTARVPAASRCWQRLALPDASLGLRNVAGSEMRPSDDCWMGGHSPKLFCDPAAYASFRDPASLPTLVGGNNAFFGLVFESLFPPSFRLPLTPRSPSAKAPPPRSRVRHAQPHWLTGNIARPDMGRHAARRAATVTSRPSRRQTKHPVPSSDRTICREMLVVRPKLNTSTAGALRLADAGKLQVIGSTARPRCRSSDPAPMTPSERCRLRAEPSSVRRPAEAKIEQGLLQTLQL